MANERDARARAGVQGDWFPNLAKFPNGLKGVADRVNALGLEFGIWVEPEMISVDSDLYRANPDWPLHVGTRPRTESRNQLVLGERTNALPRMRPSALPRARD